MNDDYIYKCHTHNNVKKGDYMNKFYHNRFWNWVEKMHNRFGNFLWAKRWRNFQK